VRIYICGNVPGKAVHRACAKRALAKIPSSQEYEDCTVKI